MKLTQLPYTLIGKIRIHPKGFGFVQTLELHESIFIPGSNLLSSIDGDIVKVKNIKYKKDKGFEAKVIKIIKRSKNKIIGILSKIKLKNRYFLCYFKNPITQRKITLKKYIKSYYHSRLKNKLAIGSIFYLPIKSWGKYENDYIISHDFGKYLGNINYGIYDKKWIPLAFNIPNTLKNFNKPSIDFNKKYKDRVDISKTITFTIDPDGSKDFDDALSIKIDKKGNFILGIHIADVSYFVKKFSKLDKKAYNCGNSTYLVNFVLPMLPFALSNELCSLVPNKKRFAISTFLTINKKGEILDTKIFRSIIKSNHRFTYDEVSEILLKNKSHKYKKNLENLEKLYKILKNKNLDIVQSSESNPDSIPYFTLNEKNNIKNFKQSSYDISHQIVEHIMILNNEIVANELTKLGLPIIFRTHPSPKSKKIKDFLNFTKSIGYNYPKSLLNKNNNKDLYNFFMNTYNSLSKKKKLQDCLKIKYKKIQSTAYYSPENNKHFGLNLDKYTHFTSPIRRYCDLVVQRILIGDYYDYSDLKIISDHCSFTSQNSKNCERYIKKMKKLRWFKEKINNKKKNKYKALIIDISKKEILFNIPEYSFSSTIQLNSNNNKSLLKKYSTCKNIFVSVKKVNLIKETILWNIVK